MPYQLTLIGLEDLRNDAFYTEGESGPGPNLIFTYDAPWELDSSGGLDEYRESLGTMKFKANAKLFDPGKKPIDLGSITYSYTVEEFARNTPNKGFPTWQVPDDDVVQSSDACIEFTLESSYGKPDEDLWSPQPSKILYGYIDNDKPILPEEEQKDLDPEGLFGSLDYPAEDTLTTYLTGYTVSGKLEAPTIEMKQEGGKGGDKIVGYSNPFDPANIFNDLMYGYEGKDKLIGKAGADYLVGGKGNDKLIGGDGDDILIGNEGNDFISDGNGDDLIFGGSGKDKFKLGKGANVIMDFEKGDKIRIKGNVNWAQEDFGLLGTYKKGTLALIGESSELLDLVG